MVGDPLASSRNHSRQPPGDHSPAFRPQLLHARSCRASHHTCAVAYGGGVSLAGPGVCMCPQAGPSCTPHPRNHPTVPTPPGSTPCTHPGCSPLTWSGLSHRIFSGFRSLCAIPGGKRANEGKNPPLQDCHSVKSGGGTGTPPFPPQITACTLAKGRICCWPRIPTEPEEQDPHHKKPRDAAGPDPARWDGHCPLGRRMGGGSDTAGGAQRTPGCPQWHLGCPNPPLLCRKCRALAISCTTTLASSSLKWRLRWMWVRMEPVGR